MSYQHPSPANSLLKEAVALHQSGQLQQAEAMYRQVLQTNPHQFDALHLLGVIAKQRGTPQAALDWFRQAIRVDNRQAIAHGNLGVVLQELGLTQEALESYERALQLKPDYAMALNNRGNALRSLGRLDDALLSYAAALQIQPHYAEALYNRGIALQSAGRDPQARQDFERALQLKPDDAAAHFALGSVLQSSACFIEALASYGCALQIRPGYAEAWCNRGIVQQRLHEYEAALASYDSALQLRGDYASAHHYRANVLCSLGRKDEAIAAYQRALECGADAAQVNYALASLGVGAAPLAAPAAYVKDLFDQYADHFDRHLLGVLQYEVPQLLAQAVARHVGQTPLDSLDAGCGTGLCGPTLRPHSRSLTGVDLSAKMLDKARERQLYDRLVCGEIAEFLSANENAAAFDLIVAADVFVYIGDLTKVFSGVRQALRPDGLFCFSVEADEEGDYVLRSSNRYAHSLGYVRRLADQYGLLIEENATRSARQENGEAMAIEVVVMRRK